ncbi:MAG: hypothetical protein M3362_06025 [Acidobacteriota bacterium]|nr:hypothetical protein [Acidobacteriota bacterium]
MLRQYLSIILVVSLIYTASAEPAFAQSAVGQQASFAKQVKQNIQWLGVGQEARIRVKLHDGTVLAGYVSQAGADSFTLIERRTNAPTTVSYAQVKQISGGNRATGIHFSIPEPQTREVPKWLKTVVPVGILAFLVIYFVHTGGTESR